MNAPSLLTIKRLFAKAKNKCAFPDCSIPIVEDSGTVTGIVCHIHARSKGGPRYDSGQSSEERHAFDNLILLCSRHSKIIDSEPSRFTPELLKEIKEMHERDGYFELSQKDAQKVDALAKAYDAFYISAGKNVMINSPGAIQADQLTVKTTQKKVTFAPPQGSVASDLMMRNYAKYLIDRYNEFASQQKNREKPFTYAAIYSQINKRFRASWDKIPQSRFDDLVSLLKGRVDNTLIGRRNRSKGISNYSSFDEYCDEYGH